MKRDRRDDIQVHLPNAFLDKMNFLLKDEYESFTRGKRKGIASFLKEKPTFEIENVQEYKEFEHGRADWIKGVDHDQSLKLDQTIRIWPHRVKGKGILSLF